MIQIRDVGPTTVHRTLKVRAAAGGPARSRTTSSAILDSHLGQAWPRSEERRSPSARARGRLRHHHRGNRRRHPTRPAARSAGLACHRRIGRCQPAPGRSPSTLTLGRGAALRRAARGRPRSGSPPPDRRARSDTATAPPGRGWSPADRGRADRRRRPGRVSRDAAAPHRSTPACSNGPGSCGTTSASTTALYVALARGVGSLPSGHARPLAVARAVGDADGKCDRAGWSTSAARAPARDREAGRQLGPDPGVDGRVERAGCARAASKRR